MSTHAPALTDRWDWRDIQGGQSEHEHAPASLYSSGIARESSWSQIAEGGEGLLLAVWFTPVDPLLNSLREHLFTQLV